MARRWSRDELFVAFGLYCRIPFGKLHGGNPEIIRMAGAIGRTPSALAMKLTNIASLDPAIRSSGRKGLRNASQKDRAMWAEMERDWERFAELSEDALIATGVDADESRQSFFGDAGRRTGEDRVTLATRRVGQDFFRRAVLAAYDGSCCITGLAVEDLLVASHIVPWRADLTNRCNPRNGLALSALHDKAFDRGLISIREDFTVLVSSKHTGIADHYFKREIQSFEGKPIRLPADSNRTRGSSTTTAATCSGVDRSGGHDSRRITPPIAYRSPGAGTRMRPGAPAAPSTRFASGSWRSVMSR